MAATSSQFVDKDDPRVTQGLLVKVQQKDGSVVKLWECIICSKKFTKQYMLARHIPVHTDERFYTCEVCHKAFRQFSTLSQHKAIHSEERPFKCDVCNKSFNRQSTLSSHSKTHFPTKKFICYVCGKGFHQKGNFRNHLFTHTNERPYKCDICHKGFNQKSNLSCHKASVHAGKTYTCGLCPVKFENRRLYAAHLRNVHGAHKGTKRATAQKPSTSDCSDGYFIINNNDSSTIDLNTQAEAKPFSIVLQPPLTAEANFLPFQNYGESETCYQLVDPYAFDEADQHSKPTVEPG